MRNVARQFSQGGEHYIELSADGSCVIKHTKDLGFGYTPDVDNEGHIILRPATANEYAWRVAAHEKMFPAGLKIVGVNTERAFTTSQKHFAGETPDRSEVHKFLSDAGFKKVSGANIYDRTLEDTT
jgi:hypothetical protein